MSERVTWGSRLGFIMTTAGFAVGLGAIWRFPYMMSKNGGGAFLLLYLLTTLCVGVPLFIAEIMLGRVTRHGGILGMRQLTPLRSPFRLVGWLGIASGIGILSYYSVILALLLVYFVKSLGGAFAYGTDLAALSLLFDVTSSSVEALGLYVLMAIVLYGGNHQSRAQKRSGKGLQIPHADTPAVSGHSGGTLAKPAGSGKRSRVAPEA